MSSKILSIDIREDAVSALSIATGLKGNTLEAQAYVRLNEAPAETGDRLNWAIEQIADRMDTTGSVCLLAVPPTAVTYRNLKVPFKDRKRIRQVLPFELEPCLPYAIDELSMDFQVVRKGDETDLIAAAIETEQLNKIVETLKRFDISPRFITAGGITEALCLAGLSDKPADEFLFICMEETSATVCAMSSGKIFLIRTFKLGQTTTEQKLRRLSAGIQRMLAAFESHYGFDFASEKILVSGCGSDDPLLISGLETSLDADVRAVNLLEDVNLKTSPSPQTAFDPVLFNGPLSLAGIETAGISPFNFSRKHYALQKYWMENKNNIITTGMLTAFVIVLLLFNVVVQARFLQNQINEINQRIAGIFQSTFPGTERIVDPLQQMQVKLKQIKEKNAYSANTGSNVLNIEILKDLSDLIPAQIDVVITRYVRGDDNVLLAGTTDTFNSVDEIKVRLEKSDIFNRITINSANMDKNINRVRFNIKADLTGS